MSEMVRTRLMVVICDLLASGTHSRDWGITGRQFCPPPLILSEYKQVRSSCRSPAVHIIRCIIIKTRQIRVYAYVYLIYHHTRRIVDVRNTCACTMEHLAVLISLSLSLSILCLSFSLPPLFWIEDRTWYNLDKFKFSWREDARKGALRQFARNRRRRRVLWRVVCTTGTWTSRSHLQIATLSSRDR